MIFRSAPRLMTTSTIFRSASSSKHRGIVGSLRRFVGSSKHRGNVNSLRRFVGKLQTLRHRRQLPKVHRLLRTPRQCQQPPKVCQQAPNIEALSAASEVSSASSKHRDTVGSLRRFVGKSVHQGFVGSIVDSFRSFVGSEATTPRAIYQRRILVGKFQSSPTLELKYMIIYTL